MHAQPVPSELDKYRVPDDGKCWWCGAPATTSEHKYKHRDLRRVRGASEEAGVYRSAEEGFSGVLQSLKKGSTVLWSKSLCAKCNNEHSQPFGRSYDEFVDYLNSHWDELMTARRLRWRRIYGRDWRRKSLALSQYLVKQFGCMMRTCDLPVPDDARQFLNGRGNGDLAITLAVDDEFLDARQRLMPQMGNDDWLRTFIGLPETMARHDGQTLTGADYVLRLGYVVLAVSWVSGGRCRSIHERASFRIPHIEADGRTMEVRPD